MSFRVRYPAYWMLGSLCSVGLSVAFLPKLGFLGMDHADSFPYGGNSFQVSSISDFSCSNTQDSPISSPRIDLRRTVPLLRALDPSPPFKSLNSAENGDCILSQIMGKGVSRGMGLFINPAIATDTSRLSLHAVQEFQLIETNSTPSLLRIHPQARLAKVPIVMYHDIIAEKEVFFDVTPEELEADFKLIQENGLTPISLDLLMQHLKDGVPLPEKPILLTFDDGYGGHYDYVYPLLKKYGYPAVFSIYVTKMEGKTARSSVTWEQLQEMAKDPLVTITSHTVTHPRDLRELSDDELFAEVTLSKQILEKRLGIPINYFTYPEGKYDARVKQWAIAAGYKAALSMNDLDEHFAGESPDLFSIGRFGQSSLESVLDDAWGGYPVAKTDGGFDFNGEIRKHEVVVDGNPIVFVTGGRPMTIHADSRYQVPEIIEGTGAEAAVDGGFFSLKYLTSNVMIGPVMGHNTGEFIPGYEGETPRLDGRPLVLISHNWVKFIPFDHTKHNTLEGIIEESTDLSIITDAFVGAAWLVKNGQPQPAEAFGTLFDFDANRHRAFWGINQAGQPVVGVTRTLVDSVTLGKMLHKVGLRDAIMVDSGASTSLAYQGESLVHYTPRPVPHVVALFPSLVEPQDELGEAYTACVLGINCQMDFSSR